MSFHLLLSTWLSCKQTTSSSVLQCKILKDLSWLIFLKIKSHQFGQMQAERSSRDNRETVREQMAIPRSRPECWNTAECVRVCCRESAATVDGVSKTFNLRKSWAFSTITPPFVPKWSHWCFNLTNLFEVCILPASLRLPPHRSRRVSARVYVEIRYFVYQKGMNLFPSNCFNMREKLPSPS